MTQPKEPLPIVLRQSWIHVMPDGEALDAGMSYHLSEAHRFAYVQEVVSQMTGPEEGHDEPIGDAIPVHVKGEFYKSLAERGGSHRLK